MNEAAKKYIDLFSKLKPAAWTPYAIDPAHCLQCGRCVEFCPAGAVGRLYPWPPGAIIDRPATPFVSQLVRRSRDFAPRV